MLYWTREQSTKKPSKTQPGNAKPDERSRQNSKKGRIVLMLTLFTADL